jgi:hypothetical protein
MAENIEQLASDFEDFTYANLREKAEKVVRDLRRMAEEVEDRLERTENTPDSMATLVSSTFHTVSWGVANLGIDVLFNSFDRLRQAREISRDAAITALKDTSDV